MQRIKFMKNKNKKSEIKYTKFQQDMELLEILINIRSAGLEPTDGEIYKLSHQPQLALAQLDKQKQKKEKNEY